MPALTARQLFWIVLVLVVLGLVGGGVSRLLYDAFFWNLHAPRWGQPPPVVGMTASHLGG